VLPTDLTSPSGTKRVSPEAFNRDGDGQNHTVGSTTKLRAVAVDRGDLETA
jgi:hypothetical protein